MFRLLSSSLSQLVMTPLCGAVSGLGQMKRAITDADSPSTHHAKRHKTEPDQILIQCGICAAKIIDDSVDDGRIPPISSTGNEKEAQNEEKQPEKKKITMSVIHKRWHGLKVPPEHVMESEDDSDTLTSSDEDNSDEETNDEDASDENEETQHNNEETDEGDEYEAVNDSSQDADDEGDYGINCAPSDTESVEL